MKAAVGGKIARDDFAAASLSANFSQLDIVGKVQMVVSVATIFVLFVIPAKFKEVVTGVDRPNVGRLTTVIPDQIYQQAYCAGVTNSTVLLSRNKDAILIHLIPNLTHEFLQDLETKLYGVPIKYIVISNELHESFASRAKAQWPDAKVLCPKPCKDAVEQAVKVDAFLEDSMETLEKEFGIVKMFSQFDGCTNCGAERSFVLDLYTGDGQCLFVAQCGYANITQFSLPLWLAGYQGLSVRGRYVRSFYYLFSPPKKHGEISKYWKYMVNSMPEWKAAVFTHGNPIVATTSKSSSMSVKDQLLQFYVY